ncbi:hypothetical protein DPMN_121061 [Dreissena polymorpha]|uniref:KY-like immunoglobulin-like domain-containing protein n=1 Tax=Dreissena polymorpha TaxID=45954 RepID=A0A9D4GPG9_DREPO|nr:hypothetical protein DPMN_121061 [Dreissena polymorpha]
MDGAWQLVHPYLMCTPLSTKSPSDDWKLIESTKSEVPPTKGTILNNFFFVPKPSDFILFCFPDEKKWQLLEDAIPYQKFIKSPFLRSAFYESGMQLKTTASSILKSEGGKCTIKIQCTQENANKTVLMYDLFSLDLELKWGPDEGRVVLCGRNEDTWNVQVKFPVEGTYKLSLFALIDDSWFFWIGSYRINLYFNAFASSILYLIFLVIVYVDSYVGYVNLHRLNCFWCTDALSGHTRHTGSANVMLSVRKIIY